MLWLHEPGVVGSHSLDAGAQMDKIKVTCVASKARFVTPKSHNNHGLERERWKRTWPRKAMMQSFAETSAKRAKTWVKIPHFILSLIACWNWLWSNCAISVFPKKSVPHATLRLRKTWARHARTYNIYQPALFRARIAEFRTRVTKPNQ